MQNEQYPKENSSRTAKVKGTWRKPENRRRFKEGFHHLAPKSSPVAEVCLQEKCGSRGKMDSVLRILVECHKSPFVVALLANPELHPGFGFGRWSMWQKPPPCPIHTHTHTTKMERWLGWNRGEGAQGRDRWQWEGCRDCQRNTDPLDQFRVFTLHSRHQGWALRGHPGRASTFHESQPQRQRQAVCVPLTISKVAGLDLLLDKCQVCLPLVNQVRNLTPQKGGDSDSEKVASAYQFQGKKTSLESRAYHQGVVMDYFRIIRSPWEFPRYNSKIKWQEGKKYKTILLTLYLQM